MCGRSCVRGSFLLPCCGAKLVPLPLSRAGMPCCGRGGTAQGRRGAGTRVSERSRSGRGGGRRARRAPPPPPPTAAGGRTGARSFPAPSSPRSHRPAGARGRVRVRVPRVRVPHPTAARGESEPRPPPGPQDDRGIRGPRAASPPAFPARLPPRRAPADPFLPRRRVPAWSGLYLAAGASRNPEEVLGS